ncbi:DUF5954 family protein [Micromonospora aurantiaca (nom. illeg.)]|uniref:alpha,alpha-trehalase n=1 Tax=Micromonospora TaxID=1873 RepID=UPI0021A47454|nr:alpha,alpha-trehalase [Micromonospora chalcea]
MAAYPQSAEEVDATQANEVTVLDRRFRVIRVETLLRFGSDGPEPPRPSDHDPEPPPEAHFAELRNHGLLRSRSKYPGAVCFQGPLARSLKDASQAHLEAWPMPEGFPVFGGRGCGGR